MKQINTPMHQKIVRSLPFGRHRLALWLGSLSKEEIGAVVNQAKMKLNLKETIQRLMYLGDYEPIETEWFKQCVGTGDVVVDVGANFGHYTTLGSQIVGERGKVFAFEPSPVASLVIEKMLNESGINNVVLTKAAVGKKSGRVDLFLPNTKHLHSPSIMRSDSEFVPYQIPVITLDEFAQLREVDQIKLIKIDVEGYEPDVLDGMVHLINEGRVQNIFCEFNSWWLGKNMTTSKQLQEKFFSLGYKIHKETVLQSGLLGHQGATFDLQDIWFKFEGTPGK